MVTKTVELNNQKFVLQKMDAIEQLAVASKILPLLHKAGLLFKETGSSVENIDLITSSIINLIKETNVEDLQFIMTSFLQKTYLGNICVMDKGRIIQPELVELDTALQLVKEHFMFNFESYLKYIQ